MGDDHSRDGASKSDAPRPRWLIDEPVDLKHADEFGVSLLVDRLVDLLSRAKPPFTVSLSGSWGVGKTTIADAIVTRLKNANFRAIKIDAWTQDVSQLRRSLVLEVGAALLPGDKDEEKLDEVAATLDEAQCVKTEAQSARIQARKPAEIAQMVGKNWHAYLVVLVLLVGAVVGAALLGKDSGPRAILIGLAATLATLLVTVATGRRLGKCAPRWMCC
jgi:hypothetical protein